MRSSGQATLKQVADLAGVSLSTASVVFSGARPVTETTREKVLAAAADKMRSVVRAGDVVGRIGGEEFAALVPAGLALAWVQGTPMLAPTRPEALGFLICMAFSVLGYAMMVGATRAGEASLIAPLRYVRLIFALGIAVAVFGERPDGATLAGAALIVGSGAFAMWRELVRNRRR